MNISLTFEL